MKSPETSQGRASPDTPPPDTPSPDTSLTIPSAYRAGYERACAVNPGLARRYVEHTVSGDPLADAAVASLAALAPEEVHRVINAGMQQSSRPPNFPQELRDFFAGIDAPPPWFDPEATLPGMRAYHRNWDLFIAAHVAGVLVRGFSTLIAKSFLRTGRLTDYGVRRLRQNNRHLMEICMPGGLERQGDGWKLTVRIRLVHAQMRRLLWESGEWDEAAWGAPLSGAHIGFSSAAFSALLLEKAAKLGARLSRPERDSFMHIWRYTAWLMGAPEGLLFRDYDDALELCRIGFLCEPPPEDECIIMAHGLVNSAPLMVGYTDVDERRTFAGYVYKISRALVGDELADQLRFPKSRTTGTLLALRTQRRMLGLMDLLAPKRGKRRRTNNFINLLGHSAVDESGIKYRLPDHLDADRASPW